MSLLATCPYCQDELDVENDWHDNDYLSCFELKCKTCGRNISAVINICPEVWLEKPRPR